MGFMKRNQKNYETKRNFTFDETKRNFAVCFVSRNKRNLFVSLCFVFRETKKGCEMESLPQKNDKASCSGLLK
jgi:hypothetical protein